MRQAQLSAALLLFAAITPYFAFAATPQDSKRAPWSWTAKERAHGRLDPAMRAERVRLAKANRKSLRSVSAAISDREPADVIDGRQNPELFFPTELFERLVFNSFVSLPQSYPRVVAQETDDLFRDPSEWGRFEEAVRDFAFVLRTERTHLDRSVGGVVPADAERELTELRRGKCAAKARALRAARAAFGRERFDRFLYQFVARGITSTYLDSRTLGQSAAAALRHEEDCQ